MAVIHVFFIYSSVHTNFGDQIIIQNHVGVRLLFQGILSLICTIHILEISTFDNTVQLHEVLVCNEVMFPFPGLLGHNTNLRLLQNIIRLLLLPNLTYKRHRSKRLGEHKNQYTLKYQHNHTQFTIIFCNVISEAISETLKVNLQFVGFFNLFITN